MGERLLCRQIDRARKGRRLTDEKLPETCNINAIYLRQIE